MPMMLTLRLTMTLVLLALILCLWISGYMWSEQLYWKVEQLRALQRITTSSNHDDPWRETPSLELVVRTNSDPKFIRFYSTWFLKSLKLFWPEHRLNLTLVLDDENKQDHATGTRLSHIWPHPKVTYRKPGDPSIYTHFQRRRMFLCYFYPEEYTSSEYVGFVDTDTMFTTVVTPKMLFVDGKPTVQARIGQPYYQTHNECWSDATEYFIGQKEALQCMTYFPVIFKVQHVVEFRKFAEKKFGKPFHEIFKKSFDFPNPLVPGGDCVCQYSVICNYVWYHHRDEYDFHLQMSPNRDWKGDYRRESQQSVEYFRNIDPKYLVPKPRVAMHARHYVENGTFISTNANMSKDPYFTHLRHRLKEGLCHSVWFERCPEKCVGIDKTSVQLSIYSFEFFDWAWDNRCYDEQKKHYEDVKKMIHYNEKHGIKMFGVEKYSDSCSERFEFGF